MLFNIDEGMDVNLDLKGNITTKNLSFFKQKTMLLENQSSLLLDQNNFLQDQVDQNNKTLLKRLITISKLKVIYRNLIIRY